MVTSLSIILEAIESKYMIPGWTRKRFDVGSISLSAFELKSNDTSFPTFPEWFSEFSRTLITSLNKEITFKDPEVSSLEGTTAHLVIFTGDLSKVGVFVNYIEHLRNLVFSTKPYRSQLKLPGKSTPEEVVVMGYRVSKS